LFFLSDHTVTEAENWYNEHKYREEGQLLGQNLLHKRIIVIRRGFGGNDHHRDTPSLVDSELEDSVSYPILEHGIATKHILVKGR
jgi:hypothetical protein